MIHQFFSQLTSIMNLGQARSVVLSGNIYDLFYDGNRFVPLIDFLMAKCKLEPTQSDKGILLVTCRLNNDIVVGENGRQELSDAFKNLTNQDLGDCCKAAHGHPTVAMELLRQLTICSRKAKLKYNLLIIIEAADMLLPEEEISRMGLADRRRIQIVYNWFSDPDFMNGHDSVCLIAESKSQIHSRISRLPQVLEVEIPLPNLEERQLFIGNVSFPNLAQLSAGLSLHALRQLLCNKTITSDEISKKVEEYVVSQLGEGVVEFSRPRHNFDDVIGFSSVKDFFRKEVIPRFQTADKDSALSGMMVCGSIGSGKTFICEALACELQLPVLVLKNIRSKWYGETDIIFERMYRLLLSFSKIVIFVDECDTVFQNLSTSEDISTEKRLTGKIQAMMSDPDLKNRILWLLLTARINLVSRDILRPGRMDIVVPFLDITREDKKSFIYWILDSVGITKDEQDTGFDAIDRATIGYSPASFSSLRSLLKAKACKTINEIIDVCNDLLEPDIVDVRNYQNLQALLNTTRKSLLPKSDKPVEVQREEWRNQIMELEAKGIR